MPLTDPFAAYNARDVFEAQFICELINSEGIEAHVVDDNSVGVTGLGLMPELHKPQVWVERADVDRVKPILDEYELKERARNERDSRQIEDVWEETIKLKCPGCEETLSFPVERRGGIEVCPQCGNYVDIDDSDDEDEWWLAGGDDDQPER